MDAMFPALAEPRRLAIVQLLWTGEKSAGEIAGRFEVTFGAISQHLAVLTSAGILRVEKRGRHRFYRVDKKQLGPLALYLEAQWKRDLGRLKRLAEAEESSRGDG